MVVDCMVPQCIRLSFEETNLTCNFCHAEITFVMFVTSICSNMLAQIFYSRKCLLADNTSIRFVTCVFFMFL